MDRAPSYMSQQPRRKTRPRFSDKAVTGLSVAVIVCGVLAVAIGIVGLVVALLDTCAFHNYDYNRDYNDYRRHQDWWGPTTTTTTTTTTPYYISTCRYYHTYMSPGIWAGLTFIASGIIGFFSAKRKTTCLIVSMMVMALVNAWIAAVSMTVSIWAQFDVAWDQVSPMPIALRIANGTISFFGLVAFILSWVKFGFACRAICCNGLKGYPKIKERQYQYQPLPSQPMMYAQSQPSVSDRGFGQVPVIQSHPAAAPIEPPEPVYLVQGHRVIGVLPQNLQQPVMANAPATTTPGAEAAATVVA